MMVMLFLMNLVLMPIRLKCCGHTILGVDEAIGSVLSEVENIIGHDKLIDKNISSGSFQSKGSITTRGLIALAIALSSSHAALSYTLYSKYKQWCEENNLEANEFLAFRSNQFGRISRLASSFLEQRKDLIQFFDEVIDENSNKLCLALSFCIASDWFATGCRVISFLIGDILTTPLSKILGINENKTVKDANRNWDGVKEFFTQKLLQIKQVINDKENGSNLDKLIGRCVEKVYETLNRQLKK